MATRLYSSISVETTLASSINNSTTSIVVATGTATTLLGGVTVVANSQFTVAIDPDTINEEIVFITAGPSGDTFTVTRGRAGSSAVAHSTGATVKHVLTSDDLTAFAAGISPVSSLAFSGSTSGTTTVQATAVAGTNTLTLPATTSDTLVGKATTDILTNKTLTSPTINTATIASSTLSAATLTGTLTAGGGVGTNGQVLQSTSTGVQWATPSSSGMTLLSTTTLTGATTTISGIVSGYKSLVAYIYGVTNATANGDLRIAPNGSTNITGSTGHYGDTQGNNDTFAVATLDYLFANYSAYDVDRTVSTNFWQLEMPQYTDAVNYKTFFLYGQFRKGSTAHDAWIQVNGLIKTTSAITSLTFSNSGGNLSTGTVLLYGVN